MSLMSGLAIYFLFWSLSLFLVLPWGVRTAEEEGEATGKGHAESAPHNLNMKRKLLWTTIVAAGMFALFYANYVQGWITLDKIPVEDLGLHRVRPA